MSGKLFLKNHLPVILLNLLGALALSLFLLAVGNDIQTVLFLLTAWMLVLALYLAAGYVSRKKRLEKLLEMATQLKERYLLPEVMPVPDQAEEQVYPCWSGSARWSGSGANIGPTSSSGSTRSRRPSPR